MWVRLHRWVHFWRVTLNSFIYKASFTTFIFSLAQSSFSVEDSQHVRSWSSHLAASCVSLTERFRGGEWWHYDTAPDNVGWSLERTLLQTQCGDCAHGRRGSCSCIQVGDRCSAVCFDGTSVSIGNRRIIVSLHIIGYIKNKSAPVPAIWELIPLFNLRVRLPHVNEAECWVFWFYTTNVRREMHPGNIHFDKKNSGSERLKSYTTAFARLCCLTAHEVGTCLFSRSTRHYLR